MANLASLLHPGARIAEAEPLYREAIRLRTQRHGDSGALAAIHLNLGALLALRHRADEAQRHLNRGGAMIRRFEGDASIGHIRGLLSRGRGELKLGNHVQASRGLDEAHRRFEAAVGPDHLFTTIAGFYAALARAQQLPETTNELDEAADRLAADPARTARHLAAARCVRARLSLPEKSDRAIELARQRLSIREDLGVSDWLLADARVR